MESSCWTSPIPAYIKILVFVQTMRIVIQFYLVYATADIRIIATTPPLTHFIKGDTGLISKVEFRKYLSVNEIFGIFSEYCYQVNVAQLYHSIVNMGSDDMVPSRTQSLPEPAFTQIICGHWATIFFYPRKINIHINFVFIIHVYFEGKYMRV